MTGVVDEDPNVRLFAVKNRFKLLLKREIPTELLADHYSNTLFLVWQWAITKERGCDSQQAQDHLRKLLFL